MTNQSLAPMTEVAATPFRYAETEIRSRLASGLPVQGQIGERRLFLVPIDDGDRKAILVTMEKAGCLVWDRRQPLNGFDLIAAGFSYFATPALCKVLAGLTADCEENPKAQTEGKHK